MLTATEEKNATTNQPVSNVCFHCGILCITNSITVDGKAFCCEGCKLVYEVINGHGLCNYYNLQSHPGLAQVKAIRNDKYAYLDNEDIAKQLFRFTDSDHTVVTFYIPGVHCSSCMWLLEHLGRLNSGVAESRLNFTAKEVTIHFFRKKISLRKLVELLATIGYEPYISLDEADKKKTKSYDKQRIYKLGVAGFCFGNIMMLSFPEYLGHSAGIEQQYATLFRYLNLLLALPVFFYCASEFFSAAWKGLKQQTLNIDAPIALAIIITFARSTYEIGANIGSGYFDSMSGIVFFMIAGRILQERTYKSLSFTRDYKSYFPIAVNVVTPSGIVGKKLQDLKKQDVVQLHNDEIIPADAMVLSGKACIDYSFVTGESDPVYIKHNEMVYAGGKQRGETLTIQIIKPVAASYLTSLWNHHAFGKNKAEQNDKKSAVHVLSRYFTFILLGLTLITVAYWSYADPSRIVNSASAVLIVACPCALLLTSTFTNANIMRIFSGNGFFLRDPSVIEQLGQIKQIVFDKTGTITEGGYGSIVTSGHQLTASEKDLLSTAITPSRHPNSRAIAGWLGSKNQLTLSEWEEIPGKGIRAIAGDTYIWVGSRKHVGMAEEKANDEKATVYVRINDNITSFHIPSPFRAHVSEMIPVLNRKYQLSVLSGDNDRQKELLQLAFGGKCDLLFEQKPIDKLKYIEDLQMNGTHVMMVGDGLNDAGALQQSNVGITLADDVNNFTPSCDAILDARKFSLLPAILKLANTSRLIIRISFIVSIVYNIIGLYFAMHGLLKPVNAAILMPCSTLSIVIITSGFSSLAALRYGLSLKTTE